MAIIIANAAVFSSPSYSQQDATKKQRSWKQFIDSFDWNKMTDKKQKQTLGGFLEMFKSANVMTKGKKDSDK